VSESRVGGAELDAAGVEALKELAELAVALKKSGLLGMAKQFLDKSEDMLDLMQNDTGLLRLVAVAAAILEAARRVDPGRVYAIQTNTEKAFTCLLEGLGSADPAKSKPRGLTGLMGALRDPDVQKGLGFIIDLAKALGGCLNRQAQG